MSRNRYVGDYHLADSLDERRRIHTDVEYTGSPYSFTGTPEEVRRGKQRALILCAAGWLAYVGAMIPPSAAMRTFYSAIPFVLIAVPLALLTGTAAETFPLRERFEHRYADRLENRFPASSAFVVILSALSLAGEAVNLIRGKALLTGDIVFAACGAAVLAAGAAAHRTGKLLKCGKVE